MRIILIFFFSLVSQQTRDILISFSRDYLAGEGDITKHLSYLGYTVSRKQTPLEEFDYAVTNLAVDLRDGVRLWYEKKKTRNMRWSIEESPFFYLAA